MSHLRSLDTFVCTYCSSHPVERQWIDRGAIRACLVSDGKCVCLPDTPMIQHGKWNLVLWSHVALVDNPNKGSSFRLSLNNSMMLTIWFLVGNNTPKVLLFFQSKLPEEIKQGKCHLRLHLHLKYFPNIRIWSISKF